MDRQATSSSIEWRPSGVADRPRTGPFGRPRVRRAWYATRSRIGQRLHLMPVLAQAPNTSRENVVTRETEACIEGFPRSGNSFVWS